MNAPSPAEKKSKQREVRSIFGSIFTAFLIIAMALISTTVDFETPSSSLIFAAVILAATLFVLLFLIRYFRNMDEYERSINANASMVALFSSMLLLPWTYLHKLGFLPELNVYFGFMFMWLTYTLSMFYFHHK